jgi:uncharacterized membrane protein YdbT with pleckstrin-like domain
MEGIITEKNYPVQGLWVFKYMLGPLVALLFFVFYFLSSYPLGKPSEKVVISFYIIMIVVFATFHLIVTVLRRANFHYSIDEKFFTLKQGVLSKQQRHIPYGVIQNLFIKQDLFDRVFGLASLTVENASYGAGGAVYPDVSRKQRVEMVGFSGNKVNIPGLTKQNAEILKGIILQKMKENPIEDSQSGL